MLSLQLSLVLVEAVAEVFQVLLFEYLACCQGLQ